ncbi:MAG: hypothetical protein KDD15_34505, partial [Lewinella sp.]|nr:hypothetical protein [Lewinella sp.]
TAETCRRSCKANGAINASIFMQNNQAIIPVFWGRGINIEAILLNFRYKIKLHLYISFSKF